MKSTTLNFLISCEFPLEMPNSDQDENTIFFCYLEQVNCPLPILRIAIIVYCFCLSYKKRAELNRVVNKIEFRRKFLISCHVTLLFRNQNHVIYELLFYYYYYDYHYYYYYNSTIPAIGMEMKGVWKESWELCRFVQYSCSESKRFVRRCADTLKGSVIYYLIIPPPFSIIRLQINVNFKNLL